MSILALLQNLGNILFFLANIPQLVKTYRNRSNLKDLSVYAFSLYLCGALTFLPLNIMLNAHIATVLNLCSCSYYIISIYWIKKSK